MSGPTENPKRVSVVLSKAQIEHVKKQLLYQSHQEGRRVTISEGIRRAVEHCYPLPKQMGMFDGK